MSDRNLRLQVILSAVDKLTQPFKDARAGSKELAAAVKQSRDALKQLDQAGAKLTGFQNLSRTAGETSQSLEKARLRAQLMTREMSGMENPTKKQTKALDEQWRTVSRLEQKHEEEARQLSTLRTELYRMGVSAKDGAGATDQLRRSAARYTDQLEKQEAHLKRVGEQQRRLSSARAQYGKALEVRDRMAGAGANMTAVGLGMGMPVLSAIKNYASLEDAMKGVAKQVDGLRDDTGKRTAEFYEMQKAIKAASESMPMENGAVDFAALVEGGARMGVGKDATDWQQRKEELMSFASTAAKASKAFEIDAGQLAEDLGKIAFLYKVPMKSIEQLGDTLNYLDDNTQAKGQDIINVMQRMGDVADKLTYQQAAALGSTFLSLGAAPEVAASASKAMVRELGIASMQSKRFYEGMDLLGLKADALEKGIANNAVGTIQDVLGRIKGLSKEKQLSVMTMLFGKEFGDDAQKLGLNIDEFTRQLGLTQQGGAAGSMQRESDIDKDSLSAQWLLVKTGAANAMSSMGETLREPLLEIMGYVKKITGAIRRWVEDNPALAGGIMKVVAGMAALSLVIGGALVAAAAFLGPMALMRLGMQRLGIQLIPSLTAGVSRLGSAFMWLVRSPLTLVRSGLGFIGSAIGFLLSPIGLIVAALASVALVVWKYWAPIKAFLSGVVEGFRSAAGPIMAAFEPLKPIFTWIGDKVKWLWDGFMDLLEPVKFTSDELKSAGDMGKRFGEMLAAGINIVMHPLDSLRNGLMWVLEKLGVASKQAAQVKLPADIAKQSATVTQDGKVTLPPGGFPMMRMYDNGGFIPSGATGIVGERGPELVNGPANITSRRRTASLAAATALAFGSLSMPVAAQPIHPFALSASDYRHAAPAGGGSAGIAAGGAKKYEFHIHQAPGQSADDVVNELMRRLEEKERRENAGRRSSFSDRGDLFS